MPVCIAVHQGMQDLTSTTHRSGEQNQEMGPSQISRDWKDTQAVTDFFKEMDPFSYGQILCNIANGVNAHKSVNVQNAKAIGNCILQKMIGVKA